MREELGIAAQLGVLISLPLRRQSQGRTGESYGFQLQRGKLFPELLHFCCRVSLANPTQQLHAPVAQTRDGVERMGKLLLRPRDGGVSDGVRQDIPGAGSQPREGPWRDTQACQGSQEFPAPARACLNFSFDESGHSAYPPHLSLPTCFF